ncbi:MAG: efflux RND transporter permease subunit, partial [Gemmatimonadota bacterium]
LKPQGQRRPLEEVTNELRDRIAQVEPSIRTDFGQLIEDDIGDLTGGEPQPIDIKIFGSDPSLLEQKAKQITKIVANVSGTEDAFDGIVIAGPALDIRVNPMAAARYGLTTQAVHAQVRPAVLGTVVDQIRVGDRMYDVRVLEPRNGPLGNVRIRAGSALLPLRDLATVKTGPPETEIDRENLKTYVGVTARLSGRDLGSTIAEIQDSIRRNVELGSGMSIRYGGQYQQQQKSFQDLLYLLLAGLVLVALVVLFSFGDWRAPLITSLCAIASMAGALGALAITGRTLNISSYVGAIMMVGLVGDNVIFAINEAKLALHEGLSAKAAWERAARRRLRPVAMTIFATGFALAPLALALGQGAQLMQPLAIAVIGGFTLSGPIVLFLLPGLYRWLDPQGRLGKPVQD